MDFLITDDELSALYGLQHIQQLAYLRGIRPYMDYKTHLVGVKRKISYTSISEQLYVEPRPGIKAQKFSRDQVRRAVGGLARVGIVSVLSDNLSLILKCELASVHFSVQNKAAIKPPAKGDSKPSQQDLMETSSSQIEDQKADIPCFQKADTPLTSSYLYLFFEKFWQSYPQKKSKSKAEAVFMQLSPDANLFAVIMQGLQAQITHEASMKSIGQWVPAWKYPAKWLAEQCWEDEVSMDLFEDQNNAKRTKSNKKHHPARDPFCPPIETDGENAWPENIIQLQQYREGR